MTVGFGRNCGRFDGGYVCDIVNGYIVDDDMFGFEFF